MSDFAPANSLEEVLLAASRGDAEPAAFLDALRDSAVIVPCEQTGAADEVEFPVIEHQGRPYVPLYTSPGQGAKGAPEQDGWLKVSGGELAKMLTDDATGLAVNPGGDLGVAIPAEAVQALKGAAQERFPPGSRVRVGLPAEDTGELAAAIASWAQTRPEVHAVHHALIQGEDDPDPTLVLGLELAPGADPAATIDAVVRNLPGVAAVVLDDEATDPVSGFMRERDAPIYRAAG
jgi:hypothetical protein